MRMLAELSAAAGLLWEFFDAFGAVGFVSVTPIQTRSLELVPQTVEEVRAMVEALGPAEKAQVSADWLARLYSSSGDSAWPHGFRMVQRGTGAAVGMCGFKAPPGANDAVITGRVYVVMQHQRLT